MVQDVIVYGLLIVVFLKVIYETVMLVTRKSKPTCGGCTQCEVKKSLKS